MSANGKLPVGMYWASSCGGCDISLLEIGARILDLLEIAEVAFWPCVADFKYADVARYPDGYLALCFFNGGIRNSEQEEVARLLRQKSRILVAYGACASDGGVPALANFTTREAILKRVYHDNPTTDNPEGVEPQPRWETPYGTLSLPIFYDAVLRLADVVKVDYELPGCPPQADRVWETIQALAGGTAPPDGAARVGCTTKTVCDECPREKRQVRIRQFRRHHEFRPEPGWCLLEQGLLCLGPATRGGCGALCLKADMRCEGCYGAPAGHPDQGASLIGALGALVDATVEERARQIVRDALDVPGTLYRFTHSSSFLKLRHPPGDRV